MLDVKKTPRRVVKMASLGCLVTLALVATLLITGHAAPQRRTPRGTSSQDHVDDRALVEETRPELESASKTRSTSSKNPGSPSKFPEQAKPQKKHSEFPKKYAPEDTPKATVKSTPVPPPNPQVYLLPTESVKLVFPDDDETVMAANLRALDEELGRPSDLHAIILESGEDADTFSRALHDFQERTYNSKKVTEAHDPSYQQDLLQGQLQYQALLGRQTKPSKRHHAKAHLQVVPPPHVYPQQPLLQADPFLIQQHPRQVVHRQHKETYRGHRRRRSLLGLGLEEDVLRLVPDPKRVRKNNIYQSVPRKTRSPADESSEAYSEEKMAFGSDKSDEKPRAKHNAKPMKLSMSPNANASSPIQDKSSIKAKSKNDPAAGAAKTPSITEASLSTQSPGTVPASDQKLPSQVALDLSSSVETDDLLDYPDDINSISPQFRSAEDDGITGDASPAVSMEMDRDSGEISTEAPASMESLELSRSSEVSSESSSSVERSSETPESSETSKESSSSVERSSEAPDSSEMSKESSSSVERSSEAPDSSEMSKESSRSVERSSEAPESSETSKESSSSVERSSEAPDSSETSKESSSSVERSSEAPESSETSKESSSSVERSSETPDSSEMSKESSESVERSSETPESLEIISKSFESFEISSETPESSELSLEYVDSDETSSEPSSSSLQSLEEPASFEISSEYPNSLESPESLEFFDTQNSPQSKAQEAAKIISEFPDSFERLLGIEHSLEISSELSSESFLSSENSPEFLINVQVSPEMIDESRKIFDVFSNLGKPKTSKTSPLTTESSPYTTNNFAFDSEFTHNDEENELSFTITASSSENSTDYDTPVLSSSELPFSVEVSDLHSGSTDDPVVYDDKTEYFNSSENYVDSMETLQPSRFDEPRVLDDAVKNSMNGKKDFNRTEQYPSGVSVVSAGSDGQYELQDLTGENGKDQAWEMTENEDSNFGKNFAGGLHTTGLPILPGTKEGQKSFF